MATIVNITKTCSYGTRKNDIVEVDCVYETGRLNTGEPCVVLKTFNPLSQHGKISQTLHITKEVAVQLIEIFKQELHL